MEMTTVSEVMTNFITVFTPGRDALVHEAKWILYRLTAIELAVASLVWAVNGSNFAAELVKRSFIITIFFFLINNFNLVTKTVMGGFVQAGALATKTAAGESLITNPDRIFNAATKALTPIANEMGKYGFSDILSLNPYMLLIAFVLTILAFTVLGAQVFITVLEYYLVTTLAILLLPFGVFQKTAFLAERVFQAMIAFGIRVMMLSFLLSVILPALEGIQVSEPPTWQSSFQLVFVSIILVALALHAPGMAAGLLSGTPSLSIGNFGRTAAALATGAVRHPLNVGFGTRDMLAGTAGVAVGGAAQGARNAMAAGGGAPSPQRLFMSRIGGATKATLGQAIGGNAYKAGVRSTEPTRPRGKQATKQTPPPFKDKDNLQSGEATTARAKEAQTERSDTTSIDASSEPPQRRFGGQHVSREGTANGAKPQENGAPNPPEPSSQQAKPTESKS